MSCVYDVAKLRLDSPYMCSLKQLAVCTFFTGFISGCGILEPAESVSVLSSADRPRAVADNKQTVPRVAQAQGLSAASTIKQIFQTNRCGDLSRGGFIWFTNEVTLDDWLTPLSAELAQQIKGQVNFDNQGVLLVDSGIEASPGGGTVITDNQLYIVGSEAYLVLKKFELPKDKKRAQVVTHPCTMYVMSRTGYELLSVRNEYGERLISFENR